MGLAACALVVAACGRSEAVLIGFGTGGQDCELEVVASTFPAGATVRVVATFARPPRSVIISATKDGSPVHAPQTIDPDGTVPCIYGSLPDVEPGRYEYVVKIPESKMPPLTGSFDVAQ